MHSDLRYLVPSPGSTGARPLPLWIWIGPAWVWAEWSAGGTRYSSLDGLCGSLRADGGWMPVWTAAESVLP